VSNIDLTVGVPVFPPEVRRESNKLTQTVNLVFQVAAEGMEGNSQPSHKRISLETKKWLERLLTLSLDRVIKKKY
jgi:hypothetical protein